MKLNLPLLAGFSSAAKSLHLVMLLYYALLVVAGVASGLLFWKVYTVINPSELVMPEVQLLDDFPQGVSWGQWVDRASSQAPRPEAPPEPEPPPPPTKREINLKISLIGVFGGSIGGVAIMGVDGGSPRVYVQDDPVKDDIVLSEVRLSSVVLKVENTEKEYRMPEANQVIKQLSENDSALLPGINLIKPTAPKVQPKTDNTPAQRRNTQPVQQPARRVTPQVRQKITEVKTQIQEQPLSAVTLGDFELTRSQGQLGIRVKSFKYRDVLIGLGLQPNDIVISVNGQSIQSLTQNPQLANALLEQNSFQVVLIRNGRQISVPIKW